MQNSRLKDVVPMSVEEALAMPEFGVQQYIAAQVQYSPKAVERLVRIPEQDGNPVFDRNEWIYEHLK